MEPRKNIYYNNDSNESRNRYNTKIRIIQKVKYIRVRIRIQIGLRVLKITSGVHNPAQAKPEG